MIKLDKIQNISDVIYGNQGPLLPTRININPSLDKYFHDKMWGEITYPPQT